MTFDHRLFKVLVTIFALRTVPQRFYKPAIFFLAIFLASLLVERVIKAPDQQTPIPQALVLVFFISAPFLMIVFVVVSYLDRLQKKLAILASTDLLTGLPNRRDFLNRVRLARNAGDLGTLILLDADHFKRINDTYGHAVGDICLQAISARLNEITTPDDALGRLGGEEFCVYLPAPRADAVKPVAAALISPIAISSHLVTPDVTVTLSAGIAAAEQDLRVEDLLQRADEALYMAKENGRAQFVVWSKRPPTLPKVA
ncbi:GGDEF domain-containing protein [Yoonia sp. 208BN28-4]|uniref:GGDEF domain-containing protein n=1 Tax=Yoonia sp. 208BN28-4 TaxID=3126505 RepID=UPI0030989F94